MIRALWLSIEQLPSRAVLIVLAQSLALTLVICIVAGAALLWGGTVLAEQQNWPALAGDAALVGTTVAAILAGWFLFRALAVPVIGLFGDRIVEAVEQRHYPDAHRGARPVSMVRAARMGLASIGRLIGYNLLAAPVYLALLFTAIGPVIAFALVNALLLGRDFGEMAAARHGDAATVQRWLAQSRLQRLLLGGIVTGLFLVPLINLLAPVIGAALATHLFQEKRP